MITSYLQISTSDAKSVRSELKLSGSICKRNCKHNHDHKHNHNRKQNTNTNDKYNASTRQGVFNYRFVHFLWSPDGVRLDLILPGGGLFARD